MPLTAQDFEKMKSELKTEVSGEVARTITQALSPSEQESKYSWQKRGEDRPSSPEELINETSRVVRAEIENEVKQKTEAEKQAEIVKSRQATQALEAQFGSLESDGVLPALSQEAKAKLAQGYSAKEAASSDEDKSAMEKRITLIQVANEMNESNIVTAYYKAKDMVTEQRKTAPVSGGGTPAAQVPKGEYTYEQIMGLPG